MEELDRILNGPDYFYCIRLACRLRVKVCLWRQERNVKDFPFIGDTFPHCLNCAQGDHNKFLKKTEGFMAEDLNLTKGKKEAEENKTPQSKSPRLCACGKPTLSPNCPYCPSCMSKKSRNGKGKKENRKNTFKENFKDIKRDIKGPFKAPETPVQISPNSGLLIDFSHYDYILKDIERLAEEEVRPVELQIIYILKSYLKSQQISLGKEGKPPD